MVGPPHVFVSAAFAATLGLVPLHHVHGATIAPTATAATAADTEKRELTPADAIATTRIVENHLTLGERVETGTLSPDGKRYLLRLVHGDLERNGDWMDLLTGTLDSLDAAAHPKPCAHLFTSALSSTRLESVGDSDPTVFNLLHWVNNSEVAFLWEDSNDIHQVMSVDLISCKHSFLTHSATDVVAFAVAPDGSLLFDTLLPQPADAAKRLWKQGFTIADTSDAWSILKGHIEGGDATSIFDSLWFIRSGNFTRPVDILGQRIDRANPLYRELFIDPSGRLALVDIGIKGIPDGWERYSDATLKSLLADERSVAGRIPLRYALIDLTTGTSSLLWDAPRAVKGQAAWSPNGDALLLAPTYLPAAAESQLGLNGGAAAELNVRSGKYSVLPIDLSARTVESTEWLGSSTVEIRSSDSLGTDSRIDRLVRVDDQWKLATEPAVSVAPKIHLETRESLNQPPQVFAVDSATAESRLVLDPNPHLLERFKFGRVERMSGTLPNGKHWIGQLIYPADYTAGTRYPLVIQSSYGHQMGEERFALDDIWGTAGMGLGPSMTPAYPGQLLATRNIAVFTLQVMHAAPDSSQDDDYQLAFETLAKQLIASGIADPDKIGLTGFSRNGHWVEFTLAHSTFPFAAAIAADNADPSYFQSALVNWSQYGALMNGAPAFGDGLQKWLARAVGFNAEHIHTPLLMTGQCGGVEMIIAHWEVFSRLKYLKKPAELYMMPEADTHPTHSPQNPGQVLAIQDRAIDWFSFWLTGREDDSPQKAEQYRRWHAFHTSSAVSNP
jgi:hypothetical protein